MLPVCFSLWDATVENGCLEVIPRSHHEGLLRRCHGIGTTSRELEVRFTAKTEERLDTIANGKFGVHIPDQFLRAADRVAFAMKRGSVLLFHRLNCHSSLPNNSDNIRWSFDLRYNPTGQRASYTIPMSGQI